jgi:adenosylmethionine-8-amino-7-oxononanoate aminotransferase
VQPSSNATHVFHRYPKIPLPTAVRGDGPYVIDSNGKRYIDGSSGAAVSCLGHSHAKTIEAIRRQVGSLAFAHTTFFTSEVAEKLAALLTTSAPGNLDKVYLLGSGSEAIEAALKLARQYYVERGEPKRAHVIARRQSYHGNTLGALGAGGNIWRRKTFEPLLMDVAHIAPCYAYRDRADGETEHDYGQRVANELEAAILAAGADTVMCFLAETVGGATLGAVPPVRGYFKRIREICDRYGILLILDEVMCGMGRTGTLYAFEQEGVQPDLVAIAKGLAGGYQPIGALLASATIYDSVVAGSGFFQHGHTYTGHIAACAAALAVQETIRDDNLLANVKHRAEQLKSKLTARFGGHEHIGDIRGRGLFMALEFVEDRASKTPFESDRRIAVRLKQAALDRGLICYPMAGLIDGVRGDHVMLAPPFIVEEQHLDEIVDKLSAAIDAVLLGARRS